MTADGSLEPELRPGDLGDAVLDLQTRLHALGYYEGALDGHFGDRTAQAIERLAEHRGAARPECVDAEFRAELARAEAEAGIVAHDPPDLHNWRWDGSRWQFIGDGGTSAPPYDPADGGTDRGQWVWDGTEWQPIV
jgi:peptidoglycan hydrolase-like protein with peptidoglycan-binding domain